MKELDSSLEAIWENFWKYPYAATSLVLIAILTIGAIIGILNGYSPVFCNGKS
jgi:ABC-type xylose transport system permease subunit